MAAAVEGEALAPSFIFYSCYCFKHIYFTGASEYEWRSILLSYVENICIGKRCNSLFFWGGYARMEAPSLFLCDCESGWVFLNAVYAFRLRWVQYESTFANSRSHDDVDPRHAFLEWKGTDFIHNDHLDE